MQEHLNFIKDTRNRYTFDFDNLIKKRKPLGFFRLTRWDDKENRSLRLVTAWQEERVFNHIFEEWGDDIHGQQDSNVS